MMGIFGSLSKLVEKGLDKVEKVVSTVYNATLAKVPGVSQVKTFVEKNPEVAVGGLAISQTGLAASTLVKGAVAAAPSLVPKTLVGKAVAVAGVGAVIKEPTATIGAVTKLPSNIANFGGNVAQFAADPSVANAAQIVKENPILSAAAGAAVVGTAVVAVAPAVSNILQREEMKKQTDIFEKQLEVAEKSLTPSVATGQIIKESSPIASTSPVTPQTQTLSSTTTKKRKRRTKKAVMPSINQVVNVAVNNSNQNRTTKKYLNREVLVI